MEFIESPFFTKIIYKYLTDQEYRALQWELALRPEFGDIIPQSGGIRKIRWGVEGRGKRGGVRVIYYYQSLDEQIWLLTVYAKNEAENISGHLLRKIKEELLK